MSTNAKKAPLHPIHTDIQNHAAWYGDISGLTADKMLRNLKTPFLYMLRAGEHDDGDSIDYYVSFLLPDLSVRHQPLVVEATRDSWSYENAAPGGPYTEESIEDVIHLIMHCQKGECKPLSRLTMR